MGVKHGPSALREGHKL